MDLDKIAEFERQADLRFYEKRKDFVVWWAKHPHNDPEPRYAIAPRIAWKCACYQDEFLEAKQMGIA